MATWLQELDAHHQAGTLDIPQALTRIWQELGWIADSWYAHECQRVPKMARAYHRTNAALASALSWHYGPDWWSYTGSDLVHTLLIDNPTPKGEQTW